MATIYANDSALKGWHAGELKLQRQMYPQEDIPDPYFIQSFLPPQHVRSRSLAPLSKAANHRILLVDVQRAFHSSHISFLPLTTRDQSGRVFVSILAGSNGRPGFVSSPTDKLLSISPSVWEGDPVRRFDLASPLVAGVGVELSTRRRNKLAGSVAKVTWENELVKTGVVRIELEVNQSLGNCPKYITIRPLVPHLSSPSVSSDVPTLAPSAVLPESVISFILARDTLFLGTSFDPPSHLRQSYPPHMGCNHRGGRPGFLRVLNKHTLALPDYSGNRFLSSLGNIETDCHVGVTFPDFETGDILYMTGEARNLIGDEAREVMPRSKLVTLIRVTGYTFVKDALPFRSSFDQIEPSPYSPPVRYLAEEKVVPTPQSGAIAHLEEIHLHSDELATLRFRTNKEIKYTSGQYVVLDLIPLLGEVEYVHMNRGDEKSPNEDGVRTTISSSPTPKSFSITIRRIPNGRVTPLLFQLATNYFDVTMPRLELPILGIGGTFLLPPPQPAPKFGSSEVLKTLWIAGGIGITPFLAFLEGVVKRRIEGIEKAYLITLVVATKEPQILLKLISQAINSSRHGDGSTSESTQHPKVRLNINLFTSTSHEVELPSLSSPAIEISVALENGTMRNQGRLKSALAGAAGQKVYVCGPPGFEKSVLESLRDVGVREEEVVRESFGY